MELQNRKRSANIIQFFLSGFKTFEWEEDFFAPKYHNYGDASRDLDSDWIMVRKVNQTRKPELINRV